LLTYLPGKQRKGSLASLVRYSQSTYHYLPGSPMSPALRPPLSVLARPGRRLGVSMPPLTALHLHTRTAGVVLLGGAQVERRVAVATLAWSLLTLFPHFGRVELQGHLVGRQENLGLNSRHCYDRAGNTYPVCDKYTSHVKFNRYYSIIGGRRGRGKKQVRGVWER
jgi:hypothetical protein